MKKKLSIKDIMYIISTTLLVGAVVTLSIILGTKDNYYYPKYYQEHVETYKIENANFSKGQIIFVGDSITDLYHLDEHYSSLNKATYNRGIAGDVTQGVIDRLQVSVFDLEPKAVVLMIGINDINIGKESDYIVNNYKTILDKMKSTLPNTSVFTMSILPMNDMMSKAVDVDKQNSKVMNINTSIKSLTEERNYTYIDLNSLVKDENGKLISSYSNDGLHLNDNGFNVWTSTLKPYLQNV